MRLARVTLIWAALAVAICVPIAAAAASPLLEWRGQIYIIAGFAGSSHWVSCSFSLC